MIARLLLNSARNLIQGQHVYCSLNKIAQELNNFYQGWLGYMTLVNKPNEEITKSKEAFESLCKELTN